MPVFTATNEITGKLDNGTYSGKVISISDIENHPQYGPTIKAVIRVDRELTEEGFTALSNEVEMDKTFYLKGNKVGPNSKLYLFAQAILGRKLEEDEAIDTDDYINRRVNFTVANIPGKKAGTMYSNIDTFSPFKKAGNGAGQPGATASNQPEKAKILQGHIPAGMKTKDDLDDF